MSIYLQTVATVIPVLLVAGMLNPSLLREYSKRKNSSELLKKKINWALAATGASLCGVFISAVFDLSVKNLENQFQIFLYIVCFAIGCFSAYHLGGVVFFVSDLAEIALDKNPHPDRLKSEIQELEGRLSGLRRQERQLRADETHDGE